MHRTWSKLIPWLTVAVLAGTALAGLGGCGKKGSLYLPDEEQAQVPARKPAPEQAKDPGQNKN